MDNIQRLTLPPAPVAVYGFLDRLTLWLKEPADRRQVRWLRSHCASCYARIRSAPFGKGYRQYLDLKRPDAEALRWIGKQPEPWINHFQPALNLIFATEAERDENFTFVYHHGVRRWHGATHEINIGRGVRDQQGKIRFDPVDDIELSETCYEGPRHAANTRPMYREDYSRITGECQCLHIEWRANSAAAVRSAGVMSAKDLLKFDHGKFWSRNLLLLDLDPERLGRLTRNRVNGTKSRRADILSFANTQMNLDKRRGQLILRVNGLRDQPVQEVVKKIGSPLRMRHIFDVIDNHQFLPTN